jgi:hypothetical protein
MCIIPFKASMIFVKVLLGVHPLAPVEASTFPTRSGFIKSKQMFNFPGGIELSILGSAFIDKLYELCHIRVTAYAFILSMRVALEKWRREWVILGELDFE